MKYHKIVLAGGNGYLGTVLARYYKPLADEIIILSRKPMPDDGIIKTVVWDGKTPDAWIRHIEHADLLVNLCGKNVNCRYTPKNKKEILDSRIIPTQLLGEAINKLTNPPKLWINIVSATIYRHAEDRPQDEHNGELGEGFSVNVCRKWEETFFEASTPETRKVALRVSLVLGKSDGVFPRLRNLVRYGLGGKQGNGKQHVAWVHELDVARITEWVLQHPDHKGIYNCTAPMPVTNKVMMQSLRQSCGARFGLPAPKWLLEIGALLIGTETELVLKSRWVMPQRLINEGYQFKFPLITDAVNDCLS